LPGEPKRTGMSCCAASGARLAAAGGRGAPAAGAAAGAAVRVSTVMASARPRTPSAWSSRADRRIGYLPETVPLEAMVVGVRWAVNAAVRAGGDDGWDSHGQPAGPALAGRCRRVARRPDSRGWGVGDKPLQRAAPRL